MRQLATTATASSLATDGVRVSSTPAKKKSDFDKCVATVLEEEGGYVDNPRDKGGPTNFGITLRTYADFHEVPEDSVSADAIKNLTKEDAIEIYRSKYWTAARCDDLPPGVDLMVFDFAVNAGVRTSIKMLQELVHVTADGSVGPITLAATRTCDAKDLISRFAERCLAYYRSLPDFDAFGRGWIARTTAVRDKALRMNDEALQSTAVA
jgi:lysozyme family protein